MRAETISVGTEILLGEITDTNATYISQHLAGIGVDLYFRHTVGDNMERLVGVLRTAMRRSDVLILCGGLGPTADDITREAIAEVTGRPLQRDAAAVEHLKEFFRARGRVATESNFKQCETPAGGELLDNTCGTAPGVFLDHEGCWFFAVPGPPPEMREMMRLSVLPRLAQRVRAEGGGLLYRRVLRLADIGESNVATEIADIIETQTDPTIALYASPGEVKVRLATKSLDEAEAVAKLEALEARIRERLGKYVFAIDDQGMEAGVGELLRQRGLTLAIAESCTGGLIANRITDVPGASDYFLAGIVSYANQAKMDVLGVPEAVLAEHGAVSQECAEAMARGVRRVAGSDYGIATTGVAGPGGGTEEKPVGLVYIALDGPSGTVCDRQLWPGTRDQFKQRVSQMALNMLRKQIIADGEGT